MAIAHITLATRDVVRTSHFFASALGWQVLNRPNNIAVAAAWLEIAPGQELHLVQIPDFAPSPFEREYGRHIAIRYPGAGFSDLKDRLRRLGAEVVAPLRETPFERFFFLNPDGYVFEVITDDAEKEV